ncbi:ABC transporter permease [Nocardia farcinica]|uniref:ABC transporter permease n=1 Tax=Nocardia farcinica TaxID=37329 RepID=UPI0015F039DB|nr:ABC transporter permease [Nocardia farcinica]MBC9817914.1 ABC transporter permease [Nocardia farcinica]MBF6140109.1 ABC transporter permease [Nocardia farcinica]MBF6295317.1 ABC transporter permease [Nocardia farcinica]MBF6381823.1 ABC transporter permease [Nocardia farcinica]
MTITTAPDTAPAVARRPSVLPRLLAIAAALALWWLVTGVLAGPESLLRDFGPQHVPGALHALHERGVLLPDIGVSLWRLVLGLLIAVTVGVPLGLLLGLHAATEQALAPVVQFLRMISPLSWAPIAVALFGIGNQPVVFLVAAAAVWPIVLDTAAGVRAIDPGLLLVARSFGATRREQLTAVVLPAVRGPVQSGLRIALGIAWVVLVPAEMLGVRSGLGYQILNARDQLAYDQVMAVIVVIGALGFVLDGLARALLDRRQPG